jgi:hypothetical protein
VGPVEPGAPGERNGPSAVSGHFGTCRAVDVTSSDNLPWDAPNLPVEVGRDAFLRHFEQIGTQLTDQSTSEQEVLDDFAAGRRRR